MRDRRLAMASLLALLAIERLALTRGRAALAALLAGAPAHGGLGMASPAVDAVFARSFTVLAFASLAGGALAFALRARRTLAAGALLAAAAYAALCLAPAGWVPAIFLAAAAGHGIVRPSLYAVAGELAAGERDNVRNAVFAGLAFAIHASSFLGPFLRAARAPFAFAPSAAAMAAMGVAAIAIARSGPAPAQERPARLRGIFGLAAALAPLWAGLGLVASIQFAGLHQGARAAIVATAAQLGAPLLFGAVLIGLAIARVELLWLQALGAGLAIFVLGAAMAGFGSGTTVLVSVAFTETGAAIAAPVALAFAAVATPRRCAPLVLAGWLIAESSLPRLAGGPGPPHMAALVAATLACAAVAAAALLFPVEIGRRLSGESAR